MPPYILPVLIFSRVSSIYTQSRKKRSCRKKLNLRNRPVKMDSLFSYRSERHTKTNTADFGIRFSALSLLYGFKKISHWYSYSQISFFFKKLRTRNGVLLLQKKRPPSLCDDSLFLCGTRSSYFYGSEQQASLSPAVLNRNLFYASAAARAAISFSCTSDGACSYLANVYS